MSDLTTSPTAGGSILVSLVVDDPLASALDRACADDLQSRAAYVRRALAEHLRFAGYLPALPPRAAIFPAKAKRR